MSIEIDCDTCIMRNIGCHDCVVTVLLGPPPELGFAEDASLALEVLAQSGLVPKLRMVSSESSLEPELSPAEGVGPGEYDRSALGRAAW